MIREEFTKPLDVITPIAMKLASDCKPSHELAASRLHSCPGGIPGCSVERTGGVCYDENFVTILA
jgi:hypothetical protein